MSRILLLLAAAALLATGCQQSQTSSQTTGSSSTSSATTAAPATPAPQESSTMTPAPTNPAAISGDMISTPSGLKYQELAAGDGPVADDGMTCSVHYTGWLTDGTKFDSSLDRGQPFEFKLGAHQVIRGWEEGVKGMRVGGKRKLLIPPDLGYGDRGAGGVIPPNATLVFEVQLLGVR